jgi:4-amino-4-deoxy-L-arabinose transferase-like glycosyltransferase
MKSKSFLAIILFLTLVFRIPSWFEPHWYGDEEVYLTIGQAMRQGVKLYSQIHDNKPPLLYVAAAMADGRLFWFKLITTVWCLTSVAVIYRLAEKIFGDKKWLVWGTTMLFAVLTTIPRFEGNIANAEIYFLLPTLLAVYQLWGENQGRKKIFLGGIFLGLGALFKMPAILEAGVWPVVWIIFEYRRWIKNTFFLGLGAIVPILLSVGYFALKGSLTDYIKAAWLQNLPYVTAWGGGGNGDLNFRTLTGRGLLLSAVMVVLVVVAKKIGRTATTIYLWFAWAGFAALLSGRPYPHYLLQMAGVASILPFYFWSGNRKGKAVLGALALGMGLLITRYNFYAYPTRNYYENFLKWVSRQETTQEYFSRFNPEVNNIYQVAAKVDSLTSNGDKIFVWGNEPAIYALSRRLPMGKYTVKYHIQELRQETQAMMMLTKTPPKVLVWENNSELPGLSDLLKEHFILQGTWGARKVYLLQI